MPRASRRGSAERDDSEELFREFARTRDPRLRKRLIDSNQRLVRYLASKFANRGEPLEDLIAVGNIGLIKAVDRYDPSRGSKFCTFATPTIVGEIRRYFRDRAWGLKVPRRLQELNQQVSKVSEELSHELGREPTIEEIAGRLEVPAQDVLEGLAVASAYSPVSVDAPAGEGDSAAMRPSDSLGSEDELLEKLELYDDLTRALQNLGERERKVLLYRYFLDMSQTEVAKRLNISQMHVSRLQNKALRKLREMLTA